MLRNGVNRYGLYGNLRTCFGVENKGHKLNKNCLPCLLDLLPVFVRHILAILVRFQWVFKGLLNIFLALYPAIYVPKRLVTSVAIVFVATSTMRSVQSLSRRQRTADHGLRTGYKRETKVSFGLRTTDYGLRTTDWV